MSQPIRIAGFLLTSVVVGCATIDQLAPPVDEIMRSTAEFDDQTLAMLADGRHLYITNCARCHSPEAVTSYTNEQWTKILPRMTEKAGLSVRERLAVTEYVKAALAAHELPPSAD